MSKQLSTLSKQQSTLSKQHSTLSKGKNRLTIVAFNIVASTNCCWCGRDLKLVKILCMCLFVLETSNNPKALVELLKRFFIKQGVAITGRNTTGPPRAASW